MQNNELSAITIYVLTFIEITYTWHRRERHGTKWQGQGLLYTAEKHLELQGDQKENQDQSVLHLHFIPIRKVANEWNKNLTFLKVLRSPTPKIAPKLPGDTGSQRTLHNPMEDFPLDPKAKYGNFLDRGICK